MKDASGASQMDPKTQVTSLYNVSMLDAARNAFETNLVLALLREAAGENDRALANVAVAAYVNLYGDPALAAAQAAREAGNAPNTVLAAACSIVGPRRAERARKLLRLLIGRFAEAGLRSALDEGFNLGAVATDEADAGAVLGRTAGRQSRGHAGRFAGARRQIGVCALRAEPRRSSERGRRAGRDQRDARLGPADAQADIADHRGMPAMVAAAVRDDDRRLGAGLPARARLRFAACRRRRC